jgi:DNA-directed RNA polymerase delta subunit
MDIRNMKSEDLESLSYLDIAYKLLKQDKKTKTTVELFKEICSLLKLSDKQYENLIGDFYTSLTVDKRFLLLDDSKWDLKENHSVKMIVEDELDELDGLDTIEDIDEEVDDEEKDIFSENPDEEEVPIDDIDAIDEIDDIDDPGLDELDELTVMEDEEGEEHTDL